jgi:hypothetical protein
VKGGLERDLYQAGWMKGSTVMAGGAVVVIMIIVAFVAGAIAGAVLLVSLASLREDRLRLSRHAPDPVARAGRLVTGLKVEDPPMWGHRARRPAGRRESVPGRSRDDWDSGPY